MIVLSTLQTTVGIGMAFPLETAIFLAATSAVMYADMTTPYVVETPLYKVRIGDTAIIPCSYGGGKIRNMYWSKFDVELNKKGPLILRLFKGELNVTTEYSSRARLEDDNATLVLENVNPADDGRYMCEPDVFEGVVKPGLSYLHVFGLSPEAVPIITQCNDFNNHLTHCTYHVIADTPTNLSCEMPNATSRDNVTMEWHRREGNSFSPIKKASQDNEQGKTSVSVRVFNAQEFWCNASFDSVEGFRSSGTLINVVPEATKDVKDGPVLVWIIVTIAVGILVICCVCVLVYWWLRRRKERQGGMDYEQAPQGRRVTEQEILTLSRLLSSSNYNELCTKLGFVYNDYDNIRLQHRDDFNAAFAEILNKWKDRTGGLSEDLDEALRQAGAGGLVDQYKAEAESSM